jgi:N-acetylmuramoyl-L-alanine amidase
LAGPHSGFGAELTRVDVSATPAGGSARLVLSAPVRATVRAVGEAPVSRLYVDLPAGTLLGAGMARAPEVPPPFARLRIGIGDAGVVRLVMDLESPARYRVRRAKRGRELTVDVERPAPPPPPPRAEPRPEPKMEAARPARVTPVALERRTRPKIVLDPGHGGRDPGAQGYAVEKEVTLFIARRLGTLLRERMGAEVILTRTSDKTLRLPARTARANAEGADLFISIHANASPRRGLSGVETYYLNNTTNHATLRLASMENGGGPIPRRRGRTDLRYILSSLVQVGKMDESVGLASAMQRGLVSHLRKGYGDVNDLGVKRGPFYVLVGAHMPCVLVETAFLTHPEEGRRLAGKAYREAVAEGLYQGVAKFVTDSRRAQTL